MMMSFSNPGNTLSITRAGGEVRLRVENTATGHVQVLYLNKHEAKSVASILSETAKELK